MIKPKYQHIVNPPVSQSIPAAETRLNYVDSQSVARSAEQYLSAKEQDYLNELDSHFEPPAKTP